MTTTTELLPRLLACSGYKARIIRTLTRKQRNRCYLCHGLMDDPRRSDYRADRFPTLDHITPRSKGGSDEPDNLALCHRSCNLSKGDSIPADVTWGDPGRASDGLRGGLEVRA